ncbi:Vac7 [Schizosaccharomyces cryophilus OY26]|uniref:Vac7 n=1 Tax=Schizosaccharomyces cryophilus (strain OY26 / ATCC MYA-4695 / CBS 11777 / NBRC 106824 / NRRL Y48691) TaxID=653667 RepID=S9XJB3_SCHCR|nr:Vac7 [Schizosaccharomyces cryophilus OY26]EPY53721.1 Vac7 [Schizosaccharomyces cryophilus OY26]
MKIPESKPMQMSVETETVMNVSQVQISGSCSKKPSSEALKTKKTNSKKKKISVPNVITSKSAMFAARVASAVDQDSNDEESENFVYESVNSPYDEDSQHSPSNSIRSLQACNLPLEMLPPINHVSHYGATSSNGVSLGASNWSPKIVPKRSAKFSSIPAATAATDIKNMSPTAATRGLASQMPNHLSNTKTHLLQKDNNQPWHTHHSRFLSENLSKSDSFSTSNSRYFLSKRLFILLLLAGIFLFLLLYIFYMPDLI